MSAPEPLVSRVPPELYWLGRVDYEPTWALQEQLRRRVLAGGSEAILLCEHPPVLTLGRSASGADLLIDEAGLRAAGIAVVRTSRGGQVTYHGPGQLVAYPIVRLRRGVLRHVEWLADSAIAVAAGHGVPAAFDRAHVGVWSDGRKLAAIGVHIERRVAVHGLALNVTKEATAAFRRGWFVPCGLVGGQVTSLEESATGAGAAGLSVRGAAESLARALCERAEGRTSGQKEPALQETTLALLSKMLSIE